MKVAYLLAFKYN